MYIHYRIVTIRDGKMSIFCKELKVYGLYLIKYSSNISRCYQKLNSLEMVKVRGMFWYKEQ